MVKAGVQPERVGRRCGYGAEFGTISIIAHPSIHKLDAEHLADLVGAKGAFVYTGFIDIHIVVGVEANRIFDIVEVPVGIPASQTGGLGF